MQWCVFIVVGLGYGVWNVVLSRRKDLWVQKGGLEDKLLCSLVRHCELTVFFIYLISTYLLYIVITVTSLFIAIADLCSTICCTWRGLFLLWSHKWLPEEGVKLIPYLLRALHYNREMEKYWNWFIITNHSQRGFSWLFHLWHSDLPTIKSTASICSPWPSFVFIT